MGSLVHPRPTNCWDGFVDKLNQRYGLGLQVPDLRLSPNERREARKTEDDARSEHIHRLIRQITTHCPDVVPAIELQFNQEARAIYSNWVHKPRAAADLLPVTDTLPSASNAVERRELRECLLEVMETHYADRGKRSSVRSRPNKQHPKRLSSDERLLEPRGGPTASNGSPQKKAKAMLDQGSFRTTSNPPNRPSGRRAIPPNRSFGFKGRLVAAHPPPNHSFSEQPQHAPSTHGPRSSARPPSPPPFRGALTTGTHSFGHTLNQESANTSMATCHSKTFSCPYDSDSSQSTVPYDDREEYKDVSTPAGVSFYRPQTPSGLHDIGPAARLNDVPTSGFASPPFTSSEEHAMIALDPTTTEDDSGFPHETSEGPEPPDVLLTGLDQNAGSVYAEATMSIRQRGPVSSAPSFIPATESTYWSADFDDRLPAYGGLPISDKPSIQHQTLTLEDRLRNSWPKLPEFLVNAPLAVVWEATRAALHCEVRLEDLRMQYDGSWRDLTQFRRALATHPEFRGKTLPGKCTDDAWKTAISGFRGHGLSVTLVIEASYTYEKAGPLYRLSLQPLKLEKSHRLARRFGADRFLEVIIPSPTGRDKPKWLNTGDLMALLAQSDHILLGRLWRSFYTKDDQKEEKRDVGIRTDTKKIQQERLSFFAVDGNDFVPPFTDTIPAKEDATDISRRVKMKIDDLLEWAISLSRNTDQPMLKLFSRLALSLSRTVPAVVLEKNQIIEHGCDLTSPTGNVMNDGIGRMSPTLAKAITKRIGIDDQEMPSGFQGRLGPYKGFWVIDTFDDGEIWIEGYPSQRKWNCDFEDADHRTFEVRDWARRLIPAALNEQFIPILVNGALGDGSHMKEAIRLLLEATVGRNLEELTHAAKDPMTLYSLTYQNSSASRGEMINGRQVPFMGGRPKSDEDMLKVLLDAGFNSTLGFIQDLVRQLVERRFEKFRDKLKITVPQSTYAFMTVDFSGVLEEGEVHLSFSRGSTCETRAPDGISRNELHGHDVLVARSPAHFPSDVQRVRAVFRPELRHLQDVIVFSRKGNVPLADLLSGGDYDGDKAWVCWHPDMVNSFQNAPVPKKPDLFKRLDGNTKGYLSKDRRAFRDLLSGCGGDWSVAISKFLRDSFAFNMESQLLGMCTNYKENVCYRTGSVDDEKAIILSTLASHLVDQAKQGIIFTDDEFRRLKGDLIKMTFDPGDEPAYKGKVYSGSGPPTHVLDWLKFKIAKPLIDDALNTFIKAISGGSEVTNWDPDLEYYFRDLEVMADKSEAYLDVRKALQEDIHKVWDRWSDGSWASLQPRVETAYREWCDIRPRKAALKNDGVKDKLVGPQDAPDSISYWGKLKASVTCQMACSRSPKFVWWVAGAYLANIKAEMQSLETGKSPIAVVPGMYVIHRPDKKIVKALQGKDEEVESALGFWSDDEEADDA